MKIARMLHLQSQSIIHPLLCLSSFFLIFSSFSPFPRFFKRALFFHLLFLANPSMFFSRVVLFAISLGALSVLATPHALHHHALHRRAVAARVASAHTNESAITVKRQNSQKCRPAPSSSSLVHAPSAIAELPKNSPPATTPKPSASSTSTLQNQPPATPTTTSTPTPPSGPPSGAGTGGGPFHGQGTFFATGLGACGTTNTDTDFIVAVAESRFDSFPNYNGLDPNTNPICNKEVTITGPNGATHTAIITDRCTGCQNDDLDMTTTLFQLFAAEATGRIDITWNFV
jgi:hypothetical protein